MAEIPFTDAENRANEATKLSPFRVNLAKVREQVEIALSEWKNSGIFFEYTDHSFKHVIDMLEAADWIIPKSTQSIMTSGDWLMLVLASYFHDLGLLVTKDEYSHRASNPDFQAFRSNPVLPADKHKEYASRLEQLDPAEADRIEYQEFVRASHGKRVRTWIEGSGADDDGATAAIKQIVRDLLRDLDDTFRRDLGLVCESHTLGHAEAIADLQVSQPYGGGRQGEVNLRYIAVILRTIDLIQISRRRAPSVLLQLINPSSPTSQIEWQKQEAVREVRPSPKLDSDGNVSKNGISTAIEVHATFKEPTGFFGLTSYIAYASKEISASFNLIEKSRREVEEPYEFPWQRVDDSGIKADGFMTKSFRFNLDQRRILDLLTGHTLYNNSTVVLRELTQNALDAVRLQDSLNQEEGYVGRVDIKWNSVDKVLTISDTGTGMSQDIIERHLLTVGSSRYQDPSFLEKYPSFHSISRFGIGVLSTFMVSDDVEITTCSIEEPKARRIALQSVHGKYLIKLLDKENDRDEIPVYPHGTSVKVKLRPTADFTDVIAIVRSWIMFPRCIVTVQIDDNEAQTVGYNSPRAAVEEYVEHLRASRSKVEFKVEELEENGVTLAYALSKSDLFQDWTFVNAQRGSRLSYDRDVPIPTSTCIEGVAVEQNTPGFEAVNILAVANATGKSAPKTNVARSALEDTAENRNMIRTVYQLYTKHVDGEIVRLSGAKGNSLTRAVGFAPFIVSPLSAYSNYPSKPELLEEALSSIPLILLETPDNRKNISLAELASSAPFNTIESHLNKSIEYFIKEAPTDLTSRELMKVLGNSGLQQPGSIVLCNINSYYVNEHVQRKFDIVNVDASVETRTLTLSWDRKSHDKERWFSNNDVFSDLIQADSVLYHQLSEARNRLSNVGGAARYSTKLNVPIRDIAMSNLDAFGGFVAHDARYLKLGTPVASLLADLYLKKNDAGIRKLSATLLFLDSLRANNWSWDMITQDLANRVLATNNFQAFRALIDVPETIAALSATNPVFFDSYAWDRRAEVDI
ncbi:ATP-binding protein [Sphingomonas sp. NIBR02145]|uniref:HD domain-containing protein n=1 Tax=Sphingomonas sp. NIBR02145 TaxID=3014784 RepID=UPI0022B2E41E|nr:ATP-binding protein [Sphingomonas sp. NIBR02145]WHU02597.1 ATP-binding protein [Sphingomonas sp. NIBR02145]